MPNTYDVGDSVRVTCTFTDPSDGSASDPATVIFAVRAPSVAASSAAEYTYGVDAEVVRTGTGVYYTDIDVTESGIWRIRCYSTGAKQTAGEHYFRVREQAVG